jgi:hypothetical protein
MKKIPIYLFIFCIILTTGVLATSNILTNEGQAPNVQVSADGEVYIDGKLVIRKGETVVVSQESDFPAPVDAGDGWGTAIHLEAKEYLLDQDVEVSYPLVKPSSGTAYIRGSHNNNFINNTTGNFIVGTSNANLQLEHLTLICPTGTLFTLANGNFHVLHYVIAANINSFGTVSDTLLHLGAIIFTAWEEGITLSNIRISSIISTVKPGKNLGGTMFKFIDTAVSVRLNALDCDVAPSEYILNIQTTSGGGVVGISDYTTNGTVFKPGSKDQTDPEWIFNGVTGVPDSTVKGEVSTANGGVITDIPAAEARIIVNLESVSSSNLERVEIDSDGGIKYIGIEDHTLAVNGSINIEPGGATKELGASFVKIASDNFTVTFTNGTNTINETGTALSNGDTISFKKTAGTLPAELRDDIIYWVVNKAADSFQVSYTEGGAAVAFTDDGTPTNNYSIATNSGSTPSEPIAANNPREVQPLALIDVAKNDYIYMVLFNLDDADDIEVTRAYIRIKI